jgi:hypothetical protein
MSKKKETIYVNEFDCDVYPITLWVGITDDFNPVLEEFSPDYEDDEKNNAMTFIVAHEEKMKVGALVLFRDPEYIDFASVAHESSHAAKAIFRYIGADIDSDECFEYLVGWIAKNCGKTKDAFGKKSKSKRG